MDRRRYLALLGSTGLAGCLDIGGPVSGDSGGTGETGSSGESGSGGTATPVGPAQRTLDNGVTYRTPDGWTLSVTATRAQRGALVDTGDGIDVRYPSDRQFVRTYVTTGGDGAPPPSAVPLVATTDGSRPFTADDTVVERMQRDRPGALRAVPVPYTLAADSAQILWTGLTDPVRWSVPGSVLTPLGRTANIDVVSFEALNKNGTPTSEPEAAPGSEVQVSMTLRNEGDRDDWFLGKLGISTTSRPQPLDIMVRAGTERTVVRSVTARYTGARSMTVELGWGVGERTIVVERG